MTRGTGGDPASAQRSPEPVICPFCRVRAEWRNEGVCKVCIQKYDMPLLPGNRVYGRELRTSPAPARPAKSAAKKLAEAVAAPPTFEPPAVRDPIPLSALPKAAREERTRRKWSRVQVGRAAGVHWTTVKNIEAGKHLGGESAPRIARALGFELLPESNPAPQGAPTEESR